MNIINIWLKVFEAREAKLDWEYKEVASGPLEVTADGNNWVATIKNGFDIVMNKAEEFKNALAGIQAFVAENDGYTMTVNEECRNIRIVRI